MTKPAEICPVCGKRTKGKRGLKDHLKDAHYDECVDAGLMDLADEVQAEMRASAKGGAG